MKEVKWVIFPIILIVCMFVVGKICCRVVGVANAQWDYVPYDTPKKGDWLCWMTSVKREDCGAYGWSRKKEVACRYAEDLCVEHCEEPCKLDYCEYLRK